MPSSSTSPAPMQPAPDEAVAYLDMPDERRAAARAHAAMLGQTAGTVAIELPMSADVDDFRRVLAAGVRP